MVDALHQQLVNYSARKLEQQAGRIESCLAMLSEEQVWARSGENENAVGNLVLHLCGNVRQWIISGVGGRPDARDRDSEFDARGGVAIPELVERLRSTIAEAVAVIEALTPGQLLEPLVIQHYPVTNLEAVLHVMEHFSGHTGQIIFATKLLTGADLGFYKHLRTTAPHSESTP